MGKISDALDRYRKEKSSKVERLPIRKLQDLNKTEDVSLPQWELINRNGFSPKVVAVSAPWSIEAEYFKVLRSQILFPINGGRPRTIMVTSAFPGEGKTFVSANLAVSLALGINEHVLLVDCDFRNPNLHRLFRYSGLEGLHEYLTGKRELHDVIKRTRIEKLSFLSSGSPPPNPTELVSSTMMKEFLEEVRGRYQDRFVIIDAPPCNVTAEANVIANYVEGIILVVMAQKSPRETVQKGVETLGKNKILGIVFNGYSKTYKRYHKYYKKYYHKSQNPE